MDKKIYESEETAAMTVFRNMSVPKAVMKNAIPAVMAMLMVLVYNLADTFLKTTTLSRLMMTEYEMRL